MNSYNNAFEAYTRQVQLEFCHSTEVDLCLKIIEFLLHSKSEGLNHITFGSFRTALNLSTNNEVDIQLLKITDYLSSGKLHLLEMKYQYIDEFEDDPIPLDNDMVFDAIYGNVFFHPYTGDNIVEFKSKIFPYFLPSEELKRIHE